MAETVITLSSVVRLTSLPSASELLDQSNVDVATFHLNDDMFRFAALIGEEVDETGTAGAPRQAD
jgi:hypothetical protein